MILILDDECNQKKPLTSMGQQRETEMQLGLALMEPLPNLDLSHRSLVSDDSKQRRGMEQKGTLSSIGRHSETDTPLCLGVKENEVELGSGSHVGVLIKF